MEIDKTIKNMEVILEKKKAERVRRDADIERLKVYQKKNEPTEE